MDSTNRIWTVATSWIPCPIGMLPCPFTSTALLPVLDKGSDDAVETATAEKNLDCVMNGHLSEKREVDNNIIDEHEMASKKLRTARAEQELDLQEVSSPMEGRLLIGGIWKVVSEEELADIESNIRIFNEFSPMES